MEATLTTTPASDALTRARLEIEQRRSALARRLALGEDVPAEEIAQAVATPEQAAALDREVTKLRKVRTLVARVRSMPALEARVRQTADQLEAGEKDYAAKSSEVWGLGVSPSERSRRIGELARERSKLHAANRAAWDAFRPVESAWDELRRLLPPERVAAHADRERRHEQARVRFQRALGAHQELEDVSGLERLKSNAAGLAKWIGSVLHGGGYRDADGSLVRKLQADKAALEARIAEREQPETHRAQLKAARAEVKEARAALEAVAAEPTLFEQLCEEWPPLEPETE